MRLRILLGLGEHTNPQLMLALEPSQQFLWILDLPRLVIDNLAVITTGQHQITDVLLQLLGEHDITSWAIRAVRDDVRDHGEVGTLLRQAVLIEELVAPAELAPPSGASPKFALNLLRDSGSCLVVAHSNSILQQPEGHQTVTTAPLPDAHLHNANDDEEDRFTEPISQQILLPAQAINEGRDGTQFRMRVPLTEVGTRPAALPPGTIDSLLVPSARPETLKTTAPVTRHRHGDV